MKFYPIYALIFLCQTSLAILSRKLVNTATWMPKWKQDCSTSLEATLVVPSTHVCQTYLEACHDCCIAGYDKQKRECHLLSKSPLSRIRTQSGSKLSCTSTCGNYGSVEATIKCPILTQPRTGAITEPIDSVSHGYGETARFSCASGYTLNGTGALTCLVNASWNGVAPTCSRVACSALNAPANGQVSPPSDGVSHKYTEAANFTCNVGYYTNGREALTCLADASWDGVEPTCTRCPTDWIEYNSFCLKYAQPGSLISWDDARKMCQADGADLMMYKDVPIQYAVNLARARGYNSDFFIAVGGSKVSGVWQWVDGTTITDLPWNVGSKNVQPDGDTYSDIQNCMMIKPSAELLHDISCSSHTYIAVVLCQKSML